MALLRIPQSTLFVCCACSGYRRLRHYRAFVVNRFECVCVCVLPPLYVRADYYGFGCSSCKAACLSNYFSRSLTKLCLCRPLFAFARSFTKHLLLPSQPFICRQARRHCKTMHTIFCLFSSKSGNGRSQLFLRDQRYNGHGKFTIFRLAAFFPSLGHQFLPLYSTRYEPSVQITAFSFSCAFSWKQCSTTFI